jgi:hypothetical protein
MNDLIYVESLAFALPNLSLPNPNNTRKVNHRYNNAITGDGTLVNDNDRMNSSLDVNDVHVNDCGVGKNNDINKASDMEQSLLS